MPFSLRRDETWNLTLARWLHEGYQRAFATLGSGPRLSAEQIHEFRKELKRLRSLLRLARHQLGRELWVSENRALRDLGRALSAARDACVLAETFGRLFANKHSDAHRSLRTRAQGIEAAHPIQGAAVKRLKQALHEGLRRMSRRDAPDPGWDGVRESLRQTYRQGRKGLVQAERTHLDEDLHEWRKQSKHLFHQLRFLEEIWPGLIKPYAQQVHALNDLLGEDHDLAVLKQTLLEPSLASDLEPFIEEIESRRHHLQIAAFGFGHKIYAEGSRDFSCRMDTYWQTWSNEPIMASKQP